ncbi:MAG TPA: ABC transporter substrate-binding protein [Ramlibacter sp.]|nr:ABC transporter substrate-binding protein [Ramlibacter sp.]
MRTIAAILLAAIGAAAWAADAGVSAGKISIGMSVPLTGPLSNYGTQLRRGLAMGLEQVNAAGGIAGREIELVVKDDAGRPEQALANTRSLLETGVLAMTGYHGAGAIEAVLPVLESAGVPLVGVASSAELLREPARRNVFNLRAGAREEAAAMVLHLDTLGITEVAVLAQDDALGRAGLEGIQFELTRLAMRPQAVVRLAPEAGAAATTAAVQQACAGRPQGLMLVLDARNALGAIRAARRAGCGVRFYVTSEAGAQLLASGTESTELAGLIVSQVVPHPASGALPLQADFQRVSAAAGVPPSYPGLEGFIYARVLAEVLRRCGREPTRRCLVASLEAKPLDLGGYRVQFAPNDRRGSRFVEMTIVTADGRFRR